MRRKPELLRFVLAATAALASVASTPAPAAFAQAGTGAERYEVTISPPKRPGSEKAAEAAASVPAAGDPAAAAAPAGDAAAVGAPGPAATASVPATGNSGAPAGAAPAAAPDPATVRAAANLPLRTLQVGAYRQRSRAESMEEALSPAFSDVEIVEIQSGGEPLYRVNVGRLPRGPGLEDLKKRLAAAGFPAFEVLLPKN